MNDDAIVIARKRAERAVQDMAEGAIKVKAFEVILERMLAADTIPDGKRLAEADTAALTTGVLSKGQKPPVPKTAADRILSLIDEGVFDKPQGLTQVREALELRGWIYPLTALSGRVQYLVQKRLLRRTLTQDGNKKTYRYVKP